MLATISWWFAAQLIGLAAWPLAWRLFARLPGRGYTAAKAMGILIASYLLWMGASLRLLPNTLGGAVVAVIGTGLLSWWLGWEALRPGEDGERPLISWARANRRLILVSELLFAAVFLSWTLFRAYNPEIAGTEKPMELAFLNGVLRSRFFPPQDPWLSDYAISYYYFGYVMLGLLARITGVAAEIAFNLGLALWFALVCTASFGLVFDLVALAHREETRPSAELETSPAARPSQARPLLFGLLGALFVGILGNLEAVAELAYHRQIVPLAWIRWLDIKQLTDSPPTADWSGNFWWWWHASRVIHDRDLLGNSVEVIDEFPAFSFLLGDMHPHVLALPFVLLAIAFALVMALSVAERGHAALANCRPDTPRRANVLRRGWALLQTSTGMGAWGVVLAAVIFGALAFLNTWDYPIYVALAALGVWVAVSAWRGPRWSTFGWAALVALMLGVSGWVAYLPFFIGFQSQFGGIVPNLLFPTRLVHYILMFGPFLAVTCFYLLALGRERALPPATSPHGDTTPRRSPPALGVVFAKALAGVVFLPLLVTAALSATFLALPRGREMVQELIKSPPVAQTIGEATVSQLLGLVARVRAGNPWTYLFLAILLAFACAVLWVSVKRAAMDRSGQAEGSDRAAAVSLASLFPAVMIGLGLALTLAVELIYLRDLFGTRMNTVFKLYYQAWILLALGSACGIERLARRHTPAWIKFPGLLLAAVLIAGGLLYPAAAIPSKADRFRSEPTLDGLAYLRRANPADMAAIAWVRANVPPNAVVLEANGGSYSPEGAGRVSMSTGNPTLLGWDFHEMQWRGDAYGELAGDRPAVINRIYKDAGPEELAGLLDQWGVDYVYVGDLERTKYGLGEAAMARFDSSLKRVYDADGVQIYQRSRTTPRQRG